MSPRKDKILVLCIDRDDDLGTKTGLETPIIGKSKNLEAAESLGISDPTESDVNAIYKSVNIFNELKGENDVEIATISGDSTSEIKADKEISDEIEELVERLEVNKAVLVTDGAQDDRVIPIIESHIKVISTNQAIVKQSRQLESSYFMIKDFIGDLSDNPETARIAFGIPAIALFIYALFGAAGWRLILGAVGAYLFVKGFSLEGNIKDVYNELKTSLTSRRASFFLYFLSIIVLIAGLGRAYNFIVFSGYTTIFNQVSAFVRSSIFFLYGAGALVGLGKVVKKPNKDLGLLYFLYLGIGFAVSILVYKTSEYLILVEPSLTELLYTAIFSSAITAVTLLIERKAR